MVVDTETGAVDHCGCAVQMMRSRTVTVDTVLDVAGWYHGLAGGCAMDNKYCLDRFWRNARILSVYDPIHAVAQQIGAFEIDGAPLVLSVGT
jgi:alkylation response protein AidB-like acyl-CoA dehydrogenase